MLTEIRRKYDNTIQVLGHKVCDSEIDAIYLYGSFAREKENVYSDIDLIVVSDIFVGLSQYLRRKIFILNYGQEALLKLDPICMTHKEFIRYQYSDAYKEEEPILLFGGFE